MSVPLKNYICLNFCLKAFADTIALAKELAANIKKSGRGWEDARAEGLLGIE